MLGLCLHRLADSVSGLVLRWLADRLPRGGHVGRRSNHCLACTAGCVVNKVGLAIRGGDESTWRERHIELNRDVQKVQQTQVWHECDKCESVCVYLDESPCRPCQTTVPVAKPLARS